MVGKYRAWKETQLGERSRGGGGADGRECLECGGRKEDEKNASLFFTYYFMNDLTGNLTKLPFFS